MISKFSLNRTPALVAVVGLSLVTAGSLVAESEDAEDRGRAASTETAILAGGCFWGMEDLIRELDGVLDTEVGYAAVKNDRRATPAEAVEIVFDPARISYEEILRFYFTMHDPTTRNRQGNDRGAEYRSAIFVTSDDQRRIAEKVLADVDASGFWKNPVVTEINPAGKFKIAESFHQDYLVKNPGGYTCHYVRRTAQK
jgi:peptide-methionine (S)-S-oxide reductase